MAFTLPSSSHLLSFTGSFNTFWHHNATSMVPFHICPLFITQLQHHIYTAFPDFTQTPVYNATRTTVTSHRKSWSPLPILVFSDSIITVIDLRASTS
jgi:hypothetical protein